jgi:serine protease inhibitor
VRQKTFVRIDEAGTSVAAAMAGGIVATALSPALRVDHPCILILRERLSGRRHSSRCHVGYLDIWMTS